MDCITSLLEQCILYSDVSYQPFSALSSPQATKSNTEGSQTAKLVSAPKDLSSSTSDSSTDKAAVNSNSPLVSVDLNFDLPLTSGLPTIRAATPLAKSTNRRVGKWKAHSGCNCYLCDGMPRSRLKMKPRKTPSTPLPSITHVQEPSPAGFDFLSFPGEVREAVYRFLFENAKLCINQKPHSRHAFNLHLAIRLTCKTVHAETARALFQCLSITMIYEDLERRGKAPAKDPLPDCILSKLESLVIVASTTTYATAPSITLRYLPSLRRVKLIEVDPSAEAFNLDEVSLRDRCDDVKSVINAKVPVKPWFGIFTATLSQNCTVEYEEELWGMREEDRSQHMGRLKRIDFRHMIINCSKVDNEIAVSTKELTLPEFEARNEMYSWMEKDGVRISPRSHAFDYLRRLEDMNYQAALNKIETGIAMVREREKEKEKDKEQPTPRPDCDTNEVTGTE